MESYNTSQNKIISNISKWKLLHDNIDVSSFDWSWHPSDEFTHVFGSEYCPAQRLPCIEYTGKIDRVIYHNEIKVKLNVTNEVDVIYMSNGEINEIINYDQLCKVVGKKVKWVKGIHGRELAIRKCAEISNTPTVLVFPAKMWVHDNFNFGWLPKNINKHCIFYARNPVNDLCYGHMAPVAYNCGIVKSTIDYGLDFTMSGSHCIIPIEAGIAKFNVSPLMTWRTAFREVLKLKDRVVRYDDAEAEERLYIWSTIASGDFAEYSLRGANDAINYYNRVNGNSDKLKLSFDWQWLNEYSKDIGYNFEES